MKRRAHTLLRLMSIGAIIAIMLGFLGHLHPAFDTVSHFRLHLSVGLVLSCLILLMYKARIIAIIALITGITGFYASANGTLLTKRINSIDATRPVYSLLHFNLLWINTRRKEAIDRIIELDPDLISLSEAALRWTFELSRLEKKWPYLFHCPEWGKRGGVRFYSKWPLDEDSQYCGPYGSFAKTKVIMPDGYRFTSGSVHLRWPWPASGPRQLDTILPELSKTGEDALFAGDFNATTWSWSVKRFSKAAGMDIFPGIGPTWMIDKLSLKYTWWAGLPIDNVLYKGRIKIISADTLDSLGSDHLPLLVKFQTR